MGTQEVVDTQNMFTHFSIYPPGASRGDPRIHLAVPTVVGFLLAPPSQQHGQVPCFLHATISAMFSSFQY
jgi:hypothetical protein